MPASNGYAEPLNPPVTTAGGAMWMEMGRNPDYLLRLAPVSDRRGPPGQPATGPRRYLAGECARRARPARPSAR